MKDRYTTTLGITSKDNNEVREENDFYATEPKALEELLKHIKFNNNVWECSCGQGHLSEVLKNNGYNVKSTDLIDRGYGEGNIDFLKQTDVFNGDIVTNPPFKLLNKFIEKAMDLLPVGNKLALFVKIQVLESKSRKLLFEKLPPKLVYVSSSRLRCARNGEFDKYSENYKVMTFCWIIFEKGYKGDTILKWFN
jgi:hypothetical protein